MRDCGRALLYISLRKSAFTWGRRAGSGQGESAPFGRNCYLPTARSNSAFVIRDRPLMFRFFASL